ncbi:MAG: YjbF family lipoprotein, partial [Enterobacter hormaechei]|nr:YjbF family lipoprotein [Enterobacter hormaechei]
MRLFILLIVTLLIQGCTPSQQSIIETFNASLDGRQDVTVTDGQIQALPYSTMYLRLDNGPRILVVLGYIEQGNSKWLSQDNAMIVTHNGRLIHTLKLPYNLLEVTNLEHDPLRHTPQLRDGSQWSRDVRWQEEGRYRSAHLTSRFSLSGTENLTLAGNTLRCQVWQEAVQADGLDRRWHNT